MKKILQNLVISLASLSVTLGVCEVATRLAVPPPMTVKATVESRAPSESAEKAVADNEGSIMPVIDWSGHRGVRLNPNVTATIRNHTLSKQDVVLRINSLGLRSPAVGPKAPDEFRILAIGDSITFGDYVDESLTIPNLLQTKLSQDGKKVTVLNAGLPGANLSDEFYHYLELHQAVQPDLVLVGMYLNDAQESRKFYAKTLRFPFNKSRFLTWFFQKFQLIDPEKLFRSVSYENIQESWRETFRGGRNLQSGNQLASREGFDFEIYNAANDFGLAWNPESWRRIREITNAFKELAGEKGSRLAMYLFPVKMQVYANTSALSTMPQESFTRMCRDLSLPCLDLLPLLRQSSKNIEPAALYYDHCHFKAEGNALVAEQLANWISTEKLAEKPSAGSQ